MSEKVEGDVKRLNRGWWNKYTTFCYKEEKKKIIPALFPNRGRSKSYFLIHQYFILKTLISFNRRQA